MQSLKHSTTRTRLHTTTALHAGTVCSPQPWFRRPCRESAAGLPFDQRHRHHHYRPQLAATSETTSQPTSQPEADSGKAAEAAAAADTAMQLLGDIVEDVVREMFVDEGVSAISTEDVKPTIKEEDAVKRAVAARLESLDNSFLSALNAAIEMYAAQNEEALVNLLVNVREEVLAQIRDLLPAPVRILNDVLKEVEKSKRLELLKAAMWPKTGVAEVTIENMLVASAQLISDMEEQDQIVDLRLLARLCLVKEEVLNVEEEMYLAGVLQDRHPFTRSNVPQRCIAFVKELLTVGNQQQRIALLDKTFLEDWQGSAPKNTNMKFMAGEDRANLPDQVRPGRFLATLSTAYQAMVEQAQPGTDSVLQRMDTIKAEALAVLDKIQRS